MSKDIVYYRGKSYQRYIVVAFDYCDDLSKVEQIIVFDSANIIEAIQAYKQNDGYSIVLLYDLKRGMRLVNVESTEKKVAVQTPKEIEKDLLKLVDTIYHNTKLLVPEDLSEIYREAALKMFKLGLSPKDIYTILLDLYTSNVRILYRVFKGYVVNNRK